ncbi:hypothetical protein EZV73_21235 [Acidaminobacter sp. JC074]|uniref:hypothetical protein n=1 Tax=Acidaminobacter sp. JC074 TaxID=2530199 RepID=UPI001F0D1445|nr:hypothetical protein [Acidaminobacter sp. JC074]MCH4890118.1 hypothetical protein [Acidaminobacter sp. JC074]
MYGKDFDLRKNNKTYTPWQKFWHDIGIKIGRLHYKIFLFFLDLEDKRDYYPDDLRKHNRNMNIDKAYRREYNRINFLYQLRYKTIHFITTVIVTIIVFIILAILLVVTGFIAYLLMLLLVFWRPFE